MTPLRMLIVDDDFLFTDMLPREIRKSFAEPPFEVATARSANEGIDALRQRAFDVVLCDYDLRSAETGLAVLDVASRERPTALRVLISGHSPREIETPVDGLVQEMIEKPMILRDIVPLLADVLRQRLGVEVALAARK